MGRRRRCLAAACAALGLPAALAAVHPYANARLSPLGDAFVFRAGREGLFRSHELVRRWRRASLLLSFAPHPQPQDADAAVHSGIANGKSYIRLSEVEFIRPKQVAERHAAAGPSDVTGSLLVVVFKASDRGHIGVQLAGGVRQYCCSAALAASLNCTPGDVVVTPHSDGSPWTRRVPFLGASEVAVAPDASCPVRQTGMYHLWFVTCDPSLAALAVEGHTAWKNPGGYLPGMMAPNLPFFFVMTALYGTLCLAWLVACAVAWRHTVALQHCIGAVLGLGMAEMAAWYCDYDSFNDYGFRPFGVTLAAVLLGAARKCLARCLLLVAAMGFGVVRPHLGEARPRVAALGAAYFLASAGLDVATHVGTVDDLRHGARVALVAPVASLDAAFILWTFTALSATLAELTLRRAAAKLELYRRFTNAVAAAVCLSVCWIAFEMWYKITDAHNAHWRSEWLTAAFWHVLGCALVSAMAATWAPCDAVERFVRTDDGGGAEARAGGGGGGAGGGGGGGGAGGLAAAERGAAGNDGDPMHGGHRAQADGASSLAAVAGFAQTKLS